MSKYVTTKADQEFQGLDNFFLSFDLSQFEGFLDLFSRSGQLDAPDPKGAWMRRLRKGPKNLQTGGAQPLNSEKI